MSLDLCNKAYTEAEAAAAVAARVDNVASEVHVVREAAVECSR